LLVSKRNSESKLLGAARRSTVHPKADSQKGRKRIVLFDNLKKRGTYCAND
jgi:hypothetical protein